MRKIFTILVCIFGLTTTGFSETKTNNDTYTTLTVPIGSPSINRTTLTDTELYGIFTLMFRFWDNGTRIHVVLLDETLSLHKEFLWEFLGLSPTRYQELITSRVSSGQTNKPIIVSNEIQMINTVASTEGSIGYIGAGQFIIPGKDNVQVFKVSSR